MRLRQAALPPTALVTEATTDLLQPLFPVELLHISIPGLLPVQLQQPLQVLLPVHILVQ